MQFYTDLGFHIKKRKGNRFVSVGDLSEALSHAEAKLGEYFVGKVLYGMVVHAMHETESPLLLLSLVTLCLPVLGSASHISQLPDVNFLVYIPRREEYPLYIAAGKGEHCKWDCLTA